MMTDVSAPKSRRRRYSATSIGAASQTSDVSIRTNDRVRIAGNSLVPNGDYTITVVDSTHFTYVARAISPTIESGLVGLAWVWAAALAPRRAPAWGALLAAGGLWVVLGGRMLIDWEIDDAYISYRYALNFVQGHGLVYNPGEPVEGYTNFLWTVFIAAGMPLGLHPSSTALAGTIFSTRRRSCVTVTNAPGGVVIAGATLSASPTIA